MSQQNDQTVDRQGGFLSILARLFWMAIGNVILVISVVSIVHQKGAIFQIGDLIFWITVPALILVRYLDIQLWDGQTAMGTPATMTHWKKYTIVLLIGSTVVWVISNLVTHGLVNR